MNEEEYETIIEEEESRPFRSYISMVALVVRDCEGALAAVPKSYPYHYQEDKFEAIQKSHPLLQRSS